MKASLPTTVVLGMGVVAVVVGEGEGFLGARRLEARGAAGGVVVVVVVGGGGGETARPFRAK